MELLQRLHPLLVDGSEHTVEELLVEIDLPAILADYHPISKEQFYVEVDHTVESVISKLLDVRLYLSNELALREPEKMFGILSP